MAPLMVPSKRVAMSPNMTMPVHVCMSGSNASIDEEGLGEPTGSAGRVGRLAQGQLTEHEEPDVDWEGANEEPVCRKAHASRTCKPCSQDRRFPSTSYRILQSTLTSCASMKQQKSNSHGKKHELRVKEYSSHVPENVGQPSPQGADEQEEPCVVLEVLGEGQVHEEPSKR
jgi:hypothetical protein